METAREAGSTGPSSARQEAVDHSALAKTQRAEPGHLSEPDPGEVILGAKALGCLPRLCSADDGEVNRDLIGTLGLPEGSAEALETATGGLIVRAKTEQLEPLEPLEFPVDRTVVIPALAPEKIEGCVADFTAAIPDGVAEGLSRLLVQMFRQVLTESYGEEIRITLRTNSVVTIQDIGSGDPDLRGVKFEVVQRSRYGGSPMFHQAVQVPGSRLDFMKVPQGVKGKKAPEPK